MDRVPRAPHRLAAHRVGALPPRAGRPDAHRHHGGAVRDAGRHERHDAVLPIWRRLAHHGSGHFRHDRPACANFLEENGYQLEEEN